MIVWYAAPVAIAMVNDMAKGRPGMIIGVAVWIVLFEGIRYLWCRTSLR